MQRKFGGFLHYIYETSLRLFNVPVPRSKQAPLTNSAYCAAIKRSPYEALFGSRTKVGLASTSLPSEDFERLQSEEDLLVTFSPDAESVSPDDQQESMVDVMSTPLLSIKETHPSPALLTPIQPGPDETLTDVPELTPQTSLLDTR